MCIEPDIKISLIEPIQDIDEPLRVIFSLYKKNKNVFSTKIK